MLKRILVSLVLGPPFLFVIWLGGPYFKLLVLGLSLLALREYFEMNARAGHPCQIALGYVWAICLYAAFHLMGKGGVLMALALAPGFLILKFLRTDEIQEAFLENARTVFGIMAIVLPLLFLVVLRDGALGRSYTFVLVILIWAQDSAAYLWGRAIGRHKLQEHLSPKKTWEGAILGLVTGIGITLVLVSQLFEIEIDLPLALGLIVVAITAQLGDLSESLLKRNLNVKDSGSVIPGHGGILDRFDSFTFATPVMYYVVLCT